MGTELNIVKKCRYKLERKVHRHREVNIIDLKTIAQKYA